MAALKGPAEVGVERDLVPVGAVVAVPVGCGAVVSVGTGGSSVGASLVAVGAEVFVGGTAVGGGCVGDALVGLVSGAVVGAAAGVEGTAGCGLPQDANVISNSN